MTRFKQSIKKSAGPAGAVGGRKNKNKTVLATIIKKFDAKGNRIRKDGKRWWKLRPSNRALRNCAAAQKGTTICFSYTSVDRSIRHHACGGDAGGTRLGRGVTAMVACALQDYLVQRTTHANHVARKATLHPIKTLTGRMYAAVNVDREHLRTSNALVSQSELRLVGPAPVQHEKVDPTPSFKGFFKA
jgi:hypothetical protein